MLIFFVCSAKCKCSGGYRANTNFVTFCCCVSALGVVEVEEGEVQGEQLTLTSHSLSRMSFAKEPQVQQVRTEYSSGVGKVHFWQGL